MLYIHSGEFCPDIPCCFAASCPEISHLSCSVAKNIIERNAFHNNGCKKKKNKKREKSLPHFVNAEQEPEMKAAKCISDITSVIFTRPPPGRKTSTLLLLMAPNTAPE